MRFNDLYACSKCGLVYAAEVNNGKCRSLTGSVLSMDILCNGVVRPINWKPPAKDPKQMDIEHDTPKHGSPEEPYSGWRQEKDFFDAIAEAVDVLAENAPVPATTAVRKEIRERLILTGASLEKCREIVEYYRSLSTPVHAPEPEGLMDLLDGVVQSQAWNDAVEAHARSILPLPSGDPKPAE